MSEALEIKKKTKSRSLAVTLAIAFVTLSVVTLLLASGLELYLNVRSEQALLTAEQRLVAQKAAGEVAGFIQERFGELESAVKLGGLINDSANTLDQTLNQLLGLEPSFRQLALLDAQGQLVGQASRLPQATGKAITNQLEPEVLAQTQQGERYIGPVGIDGETFEPLVIMAVPVFNVFGENQGTLVAEVNLKFMWDLVDNLQVGQEGAAYVVDQQGNLLAYGDVTRVIAGENLSNLAEVAEFVNRDDGDLEFEETSGEITTGIEGTDVLATYVSLGVPNWAVVAELPIEETYPAIIENIIIFAAITVVLAGLAAVAGVYLARQLASPVQHLTDTVGQISEGNLRLQAEPVGPTEIQQLAGAFNQMTGQLNELIDSLEERVKARTHRLETMANLGSQLTSIFDVDQLLNVVVNQIRDQFGYYYAQAYLLDTDTNSLKLAGATGVAGQSLLAQGHTISVGRGMVGKAAQSRSVVLSSNLSGIVAPELIGTEKIDSVYQRETDTEFRRQWYHNYLNRAFGNIEDLAADLTQSGRELKLAYLMYDVGEFSIPIKQGAQDAAHDLGIDLEFIALPHSTQPVQLLKAFDKFLDIGKDGLAVVPQFQSAWPPYLNRAARAGVPVVLANLTGPDISQYPWFGQDGYQGGFALAIEFKRYLQVAGYQTGEIVVGISGTRESGQVARYQGFREGLMGTDFTCSELFNSDTIDPVADKKRWTAFINAHPDLIAAVGLTAQGIPTLAKIKTETKADWLIAGFDLQTATLQAIKNRVAQLTVAQHPYLQGYLPILALVQYLQQGKRLSDWMVEGWLPNPLLPDTKSEVSVPIMLEGQIEGVLDVQSDKVNGLDESDIALLQSLANQVAISIRNVRQFNQVQDALTEAELLQEQYIERAWDRSRLERFSNAQAKVRLGDTSIPNTEEDEQLQSIAPVLTTPIQLRQMVIGQLELADANSRRAWSKEELALIEAVIDQVAQSAENLRLFEETRERAGREAVIREITDKLRAAPNIDSLLETAARELGSRIGVRHTVLELGVETTSSSDGNGNGDVSELL